MANWTSLTFKVGDLAEARSFMQGYRGAWFRCKILDTRKRKGVQENALEYNDFPDEPIEWAKLYQVPYHIRGRGEKKYRELMLRPSYPPVFNRKQMPDVSSISQVSVIVDGTWKVGDLVDCWISESYWTGEIRAILSNDIARIELLRPPLGEGSFYEVSFKDLRPTMHWSPERGWEIPPQKDRRAKPCASLIKPINQVSGRSPAFGENREANVVAEEISSNSRATSDDVKSEKTADDKLVPEPKDSRKSKRTVHGESAGTAFHHTSAKIEVQASEADVKFGNLFSGTRGGEAFTLHSSECNSPEAVVLDLQRCLNRVKTLQSILLRSMASPIAPVTPQHRWTFVPPSYSSEDHDSSGAS